MRIREIIPGKLTEFYPPARTHGICIIEKVIHLGDARFEITGKCCECNKTKSVVI